MSRCLLVNVLISVLLSGCASGPLTVIEHQRNLRDRRSRTPTEGTYTLCRTSDGSTLQTCELERDETIGFERIGDEQLLAWYGEEVIPLDDEGYRWVRMPLTHKQAIRHALLKSGDNTLAGAEMLGEAIGGILLLPLLLLWCMPRAPMVPA
jgi:hypothetical protein